MNPPPDRTCPRFACCGNSCASQPQRLAPNDAELVHGRYGLHATTWPYAMRVHVDSAARHLAEEGFSELVAAALAESGLDPMRLELEITESTALSAAEATLHSVAVVTEAGVTLALDDFGTGYSAI